MQIADWAELTNKGQPLTDRPLQSKVSAIPQAGVVFGVAQHEINLRSGNEFLTLFMQTLALDWSLPKPIVGPKESVLSKSLSQSKTATQRDFETFVSAVMGAGLVGLPGPPTFRGRGRLLQRLIFDRRLPFSIFRRHVTNNCQSHHSVNAYG
jgi:hypothetical protein